ncbi:MAG: hypothetical protein HY000_37470 [Planctomycetes bacterium]|nr:hypothetical protein [Planctomycetota bacterium]
MRSWKPLLLTLPLLWPLPVKAQAPDAQSDLAANAAVQYWQAFALMPALDKEQEKLLENWATVPLDAAAMRLIDSSAQSRIYLHRGAKRQRCDWGLDYSDGMTLMLPHLAKARDLARLAALHARHEFEQGHWKAGREDATSMMALARHAGRDPIMIAVLVRYLIEGTMVDLVAPYVPQLKAPYAESAAMFEALPPAVTLQQTIVTEKKFMAEWLLNKLREAERAKPGAWREIWQQAVLSSPDVPEVAKSADTFEKATKLLEDLLPVYDELVMHAALPKEQFDAQYPVFKEKTRAALPLAGFVLPAVDKYLATEHRNQARLAMLLAAIAVAQDGPEKLKEIKDPFGDGPFEFRPLDQGFELKSKLLFEGKPVTLTVGQRAKE